MRSLLLVIYALALSRVENTRAEEEAASASVSLSVEAIPNEEHGLLPANDTEEYEYYENEDDTLVSAPEKRNEERCMAEAERCRKRNETQQFSDSEEDCSCELCESFCKQSNLTHLCSEAKLCKTTTATTPSSLDSATSETSHDRTKVDDDSAESSFVRDDEMTACHRELSRLNGFVSDEANHVDLCTVGCFDFCWIHDARRICRRYCLHDSSRSASQLSPPQTPSAADLVESAAPSSTINKLPLKSNNTAIYLNAQESEDSKTTHETRSSAKERELTPSSISYSQLFTEQPPEVSTSDRAATPSLIDGSWPSQQPNVTQHADFCRNFCPTHYPPAASDSSSTASSSNPLLSADSTSSTPPPALASATDISSHQNMVDRILSQTGRMKDDTEGRMNQELLTSMDELKASTNQKLTSADDNSKIIIVSVIGAFLALVVLTFILVRRKQNQNRSRIPADEPPTHAMLALITTSA